MQKCNKHGNQKEAAKGNHKQGSYNKSKAQNRVAITCLTRISSGVVAGINFAIGEKTLSKVFFLIC